MRGGFKVIDTTRHVVEPADLWDKQVEKPYKGSGAVQVDVRQGAVTVRGRPVVRPGANVLADPLYKEAFKDALRASFSAESNLIDMDREGIDAAVLLPTFGMYVIWSDHIDTALSAALCRAYNTWLQRYCRADPKRLKGVALLPLQEPAEAAKELRRSVQDLGLVAGLMRPNPLVGRKLHDPAYDVLYREAEALGVPMVVSELGGTVLPEIGVDRFDSVYAREAVLDPFEMMLAFISFMGHNVLERFPNLRVGYLGAGVGWIPYWIDRVDEHWGGPFGTDAPSTQAPGHLFKTQGFAAADPWERTLPEVLEECGQRTVVWGSQYPQPEVAPLFPNELEGIIADRLLTKAQKKAILWDNAAALFGIA